jgi:hypothetical protein
MNRKSWWQEQQWAAVCTQRQKISWNFICQSTQSTGGIRCKPFTDIDFFIDGKNLPNNSGSSSGSDSNNIESDHFAASDEHFDCCCCRTFMIQFQLLLQRRKCSASACMCVWVCACMYSRKAILHVLCLSCKKSVWNVRKFIKCFHCHSLQFRWASSVFSQTRPQPNSPSPPILILRKVLSTFKCS